MEASHTAKFNMQRMGGKEICLSVVISRILTNLKYSLLNKTDTVSRGGYRVAGRQEDMMKGSLMYVCTAAPVTLQKISNLMGQHRINPTNH